MDTNPKIFLKGDLIMEEIKDTNNQNTEVDVIDADYEIREESETPRGGIARVILGIVGAGAGIGALIYHGTKKKRKAKWEAKLEAEGWKRPNDESDDDDSEDVESEMTESEE
jgi:hypothetical protein